MEWFLFLSYDRGTLWNNLVEFCSNTVLFEIFHGAVLHLGLFRQIGMDYHPFGGSLALRDQGGLTGCRFSSSDEFKYSIRPVHLDHTNHGG